MSVILTETDHNKINKAADKRTYLVNRYRRECMNLKRFL